MDFSDGFIYSKITKDIFRSYKIGGVSKAARDMLYLRYHFSESSNGCDLVSAFHDAIKDDLVELGIPLMYIDRIVPKKMSRDEFKVWQNGYITTADDIKEFKRKMVFNSNSKNEGKEVYATLADGGYIVTCDEEMLMLDGSKAKIAKADFDQLDLVSDASE